MTNLKIKYPTILSLSIIILSCFVPAHSAGSPFPLCSSALYLFSSSAPLLPSPFALCSATEYGGLFAQKADSLTTAPYLIEPGDVLEVVILGEEELNRTLMVMHNGNISFPMIGDVRVTGLTTDDAATVIAVRLTKYFTHPVVSVILKSPTLPHVSVFGEVLKPGAVEYQRGLRVSDYIALAGGYTQLAYLNKVKVVRFHDNKPVVSSVNLDAVLKKGLNEQNFELKSGDWIYVPRRFSINWGTILQLATLAVTVANLIIIVGRQ
jgi:polysaccharide export outer membrane protein